MKKRLISLSCTGAFLAVATSFAAGNGSGYGGPTFEGQAIPSELERAIPFDVTQTAADCLTGVHGGVSGVLPPLYREIFGSGPAHYFSWIFSEAGVNEASLALARLVRFVLGVDFRNTSVLTEGNVHVGGFINPDNVPGFVFRDVDSLPSRVNFLFEVKAPNKGDPEQNLFIEINRGSPHSKRLQVAGGFPYLSFRGLHEEDYTFRAGYGGTGRQKDFTAKRWVMNALDIRVPSALRSDAPLVDADTGEATSYTINTQEYAECLQSAVQRETDRSK